MFYIFLREESVALRAILEDVPPPVASATAAASAGAVRRASTSARGGGGTRQGDRRGVLRRARREALKAPEARLLRHGGLWIEAVLADIERLNRPLHRAYPLKEQLRKTYRLSTPGDRLLEEWLEWTRRCRLRAFGFHSPEALIPWRC
jgi:hypothetical protein